MCGLFYPIAYLQNSDALSAETFGMLSKVTDVTVGSIVFRESLFLRADQRVQAKLRLTWPSDKILR